MTMRYKMFEYDEAIIQAMKEDQMVAEIEACERSLKRAEELIKNQGRERARNHVKRLTESEKQAMKQAMCNWGE